MDRKMRSPTVGANYRGVKYGSKREEETSLDLMMHKKVTQGVYRFRPLYGGGKSTSPVLQRDVLPYRIAVTKGSEHVTRCQGVLIYISLPPGLLLRYRRVKDNLLHVHDRR